jgi:hypothetical protein
MRFIPRAVVDQQYAEYAERRNRQRGDYGAAERWHRMILVRNKFVHRSPDFCNPVVNQATAGVIVPRAGSTNSPRLREQFPA